VAVGGQQLGVGAAFDDASLVHDQDEIGFFDGRQAVRDDQRRPAGHHPVEGALDVAFGFAVERRGRLVENQDRRVLEQCPGNRQALALATREHDAVFTDQGVEAAGRRSMNSRAKAASAAASTAERGTCGQIAVGDVAGDGVVEQHYLLRDQRDVLAQVAQGVVLDVDPVDQDLAGVVVVEAGNQTGQGRLAAARTTDEGDHLPGFDREADLSRTR
jgi:hypothetical protein